MNIKHKSLKQQSIPERMSKRRLSKSEVRELGERLTAIPLELSKKDAVDIVEAQGERSYLVNQEVWLFEEQGLLVPHLRLIHSKPTMLRRVAVDMGAVRFVTNGADVMRPGIVEIDAEIRQGELVAVVDAVHKKALAVGVALLATEEMRAATNGKVVKNLHWVGDRWWEASEH
jgi:PUA-domain protein